MKTREDNGTMSIILQIDRMGMIKTLLMSLTMMFSRTKVELIMRHLLLVLLDREKGTILSGKFL